MKIRLSHSALEEYLTCERKFELNRLLESHQGKRTNEHFAFGHAYEAGCTTYILTGSQDKAVWDAYLAYHGMEDDVICIPETARKNEMVATNLVLASMYNLDTMMEEWEVATFQGKPAVQLSFRIDIDDLFYYVGYVDLVMRNRYSGKYMVKDFKTTGMNLLTLDPLYANSPQLIGYSIVIDSVVGKENSDYDVGYFVGQLGSGNGFQPKIHDLLFTKSLKDRLNFFITLGTDVERMRRQLDMGIFPQRLAGCLHYNKPCFHFGGCGLHSLDRRKTQEEDTTEYQFTFKLEDLIQDHLERIME